MNIRLECAGVALSQSCTIWRKTDASIAPENKMGVVFWCFIRDLNHWKKYICLGKYDIVAHIAGEITTSSNYTIHCEQNKRNVNLKRTWHTEHPVTHVFFYGKHLSFLVQKWISAINADCVIYIVEIEFIVSISMCSELSSIKRPSLNGKLLRHLLHLFIFPLLRKQQADISKIFMMPPSQLWLQLTLKNTSIAKRGRGK